MNGRDTFGATFGAWLHEEAEHRVPDHLAEVLVRTAATRQRPWWSSPERWLPMDVTLRPPLVPPRFGRLLLTGLAILAIAGLALLYAGSRPRPLPAPFGPAGNGTVISSSDGDVYRIDPVTGTRTDLIVDPAFDFSPGFSRDGTKVMFLRSAEEPGDGVAFLSLMLADPDGSNVVALTEPVRSLEWFDWSPAGDRIAFLSRHPNGTGLINVIDVATREVDTLNVGVSAHFLNWLPPDGNEIVFRGEGRIPELLAVDPTTGVVRALTTVRSVTEYDVQIITIAPDGNTIAFVRWPRDLAGPTIRVLDVPSGTETLPPGAAGAFQSVPAFSPDGLSMAYVRVMKPGSVQVVVAPLEGGDGQLLGPVHRVADNYRIDMNLAFAPDGSAVIARYGSDDTSIIRWLPLDGSPGHVLDSGSFNFVDVQRIVP